MWFYTIDLPGFSALPGIKAPFHGNGQSVLNPGTTVYKCSMEIKSTFFVKKEKNCSYHVKIPFDLTILVSSKKSFQFLCPERNRITSPDVIDR